MFGRKRNKPPLLPEDASTLSETTVESERVPTVPQNDDGAFKRAFKSGFKWGAIVGAIEATRRSK